MSTFLFFTFFWYAARVLDREQPILRTKEAFVWKRFHTLEDIYAWLDTKIAEHPNILTNINIGETHEGRIIRAVKLSHRNVSNILLNEMQKYMPEHT